MRNVKAAKIESIECTCTLTSLATSIDVREAVQTCGQRQLSSSLKALLVHLTVVGCVLVGECLKRAVKSTAECSSIGKPVPRESHRLTLVTTCVHV